jgi:pimeloyl-ACP methyl ester carboxylesterase
VFVSNWITNCEVFPELPSIPSWVEAMTSLGRLIFFDQPGTGASDPVMPGAVPTMEQWADSITAVLDDLGSREAVVLAVDGAFAPAALFAATYPSRTTALVALEGYADPLAESAGGMELEEGRAAFVAMWGTGEPQHAVNPDMPWNEEIRVAWARLERLTSSPRTVALMQPLFAEQDVRAVLPTIHVPTLVLQHTDDQSIPPAQGKYIADHIEGAKYAELPGRNMYRFVEPWRASSRRSPSSSPATRLMLPMIECSPRCSSPTSWTRHVMPRRSATVIGMPCSTRTTPSAGHSCLAFEAAR